MNSIPIHTTPGDALQQKALLVHERLAAAYDAPIPFFSSKDPLSELVSAILSHRTRNQDSGRAYKALRARFPTWEEVRDAPTADVEASIEGLYLQIYTTSITGSLP